MVEVLDGLIYVLMAGFSHHDLLELQITKNLPPSLSRLPALQRETSSDPVSCLFEYFEYIHEEITYISFINRESHILTGPN